MAKQIEQIAEDLAEECDKGEFPEDLEPQELAYILRKLLHGYTSPRHRGDE
jgi:hypothetical protein